MDALMNGMAKQFQRAAIRQQCPVCSAPMVEIDRMKERDSTIIWYQCAKTECGGRWIRRADVTVALRTSRV